METHSEQQVGGTLTDSLLHEIMGPGYLPDISSLTTQFETGYEGPFLEILEQPKQRGFRFRYPCEGPSHGGLPGEFSDSKNRSYPSVQLNNYRGDCRIVVSLVTEEEPHMPHAHSLTGKHLTKDGIVTVQIGMDQGMTASFPNLGIQHVTKKNVSKVLTERYTQMQALQTATLTALANSNNATMPLLSGLVGDNNLLPGQRGPFDRNLASAVAGEETKKILKLVKDQSKNMNLSAVRLCFQAYLPNENGNFTKPLKPCISNPVYDSKAPGSCQLKICRMDKKSGCVIGGDEIYLLCDRVQREDVEIHFFEYDKDHNKLAWEDVGSFAPSDVHRQFAIVFKTPAYYNIAIERPVDVLIELRRKSDKETSESFTFTYTPQMFDTEQIGAKRRKKVPHFSEYFPPGGPPGSSGGGGGSSFGIGNLGGFDFGPFLTGTSSSTTTQQMQGNTSSGGTQNAASPTTTQPPQDRLKELALAIAENTASAMRDYAATGDVRYLLSIQRQVTAVQNDDGDTALHLAVINCQFTAVEGLVSVMKGLQGDLINMFNYLRQTPLHLATLTKRQLTIECLLRGNANPTVQDRHGNTPVHTACAQGDGGCLRVLFDRTLRKETDEFPELHWQNYNGYTPLHLAVIKGSREVIKLLLSVGANVEDKDGTCGRTPLHLAVEHNNIAIAGYLILEAKCDVDSCTYDDNTPLHLAAGLGLEGQTALLVAAGADTMATNNEDETPYSLATIAEVKMILGDDEGPEIDMVNGSDSDPVIKDMAADVNKDVSRFTSPPEETKLLTSSNHGNTKNLQDVKDMMDREDSGVEGDSGYASHSLERAEDSFSWSSHPDKIMRPIIDHEPRFELDQNQPMGRTQ